MAHLLESLIRFVTGAHDETPQDLGLDDVKMEAQEARTEAEKLMEKYAPEVRREQRRRDPAGAIRAARQIREGAR